MQIAKVSLSYRAVLMTMQKRLNLSAPVGYRTQAIDISVEADLLDFHLLRQRSVTERVAIAARLINGARAFSLQCLKQQFANLDAQQFARKIAEAWLQEDCPSDYVPQGSPMTWIQNSAELATQLHSLFERADIPYYITGGVAAIAYGDPRTTRDLDVVIQVPRDRIAQLQGVLEQSGFYVAGADDVAAGRMKTLQVTQVETISRADLMVAEGDFYSQQQFDRRRRFAFPGGTEVYLASPEDVVVSKLRWGLRSGSEKQQRDVLAIFKVQQGELDYSYVYRWGAEFGLLEVLQDLTTQAGVRQVADRQWGISLYPIAQRAFSLAQRADVTSLSAEGIEQAVGRFYVLSLNQRSRAFMIVETVSDRLVAQFDEAGRVVVSQPSLRDRQQWLEIEGRLKVVEQQTLQQDEQMEM